MHHPIPARTRGIALALLGTILAGAAGPAAAGDIVRGEAVFQRCMTCHALAPNGSQENGPTLHGMFGRKAGTVSTYPSYSEAMKASGITWTPETLDQFLAKPKEVVEGNTMNFSALRKADDRADLIAFLLEKTK